MMDLTILSLSFLTFSLLAYFIFHTHHHHHRRTTTTPCPHSYPLIGNLIALLKNRHRFHDWVAEMISTTPHLTIQVNGFLHITHGICTANPENVDHILHTNFHNYIKGSRFQSVLHELLGYGVFNVDGELWFAQRKIASHEFSSKSLKRFISSTVESQLGMSLIPRLSTVCDDEIVIDLQEVFRKFMFDNICSVAFGVDVDVDDPNSKKSSFVDAFDFAVEVNIDRFVSPLPLIWKTKRFLNVGSEKRYRDAIKIIDEYAMNIILCKEKIEENKEGNEQKQSEDLLSRFMHSSSSFGFRDQDEKRKFLRDIVNNFILAGKDITSTALTWFFWVISGHPRCENLIYNELKEALSASQQNCPGKFSYDQLKNLNYLHASITESLRLFPPVPINSKLAVSADILTSGDYVGKGWFADYSAYAMGRMKRLWGENCMEFIPERWLNDDGEFQSCDQFKFPVFHCGPRMCLGKEMAYVQMKCVAAALMYEFKVVAIDGGRFPERVLNPPYCLSINLKMKGGLNVRLHRRGVA